MKKTIKLALFALICLLISPSIKAQNTNQLIIGKWKESGRGTVGQNEVPNTISAAGDSELNNKWTFTKDSVFYSSTINKKARYARGKYSIKDNVLFFYDEAEYKIVRIDANEMTVVSAHGNKTEMFGFPLSGVAGQLKRQDK